MPIAYPQTPKLTQVLLSREEIFSLIYHDIFEYPLTMEELVRWAAGTHLVTEEIGESKMAGRNGYFFLEGREGTILKRLMRKRISARKLEIAKESARILSLIPTIKMVAVTGALSMENASSESDIDLMIITKKGTLWTTRLTTYLILRITNYALRRPDDKDQRDKLCLNIWLDESNLIWHSKKRNVYTAHEIAQIRPIINRDRTYEKLISKNRWIKDYWPNAVRATKEQKKTGTKEFFGSSVFNFFISLVEKIAFKFQYAYMKRKITRETVTPTRALFHPVDWSKFVLQKLSS